MTWHEPEDDDSVPGEDGFDSGEDGFDSGEDGFDSGENGFDSGENGFDPGEADFEDPPVTRWPMDWHGLYPRERWMWFEQLWHDVCALHVRYRLAVRSGWWEDQIQVETLAAFAAWVARYDSGEWDDPPGKLALLYDIERINVLLRDGNDPFHPDRDRVAFARFLLDAGCEPAAAD